MNYSRPYSEGDDVEIEISLLLSFILLALFLVAIYNDLARDSRVALLRWVIGLSVFIKIVSLSLSVMRFWHKWLALDVLVEKIYKFFLFGVLYVFVFLRCGYVIPVQLLYQDANIGLLT